jgi:hypothetical protein
MFSEQELEVSDLLSRLVKTIDTAESENNNVRCPEWDLNPRILGFLDRVQIPLETTNLSFFSAVSE